MMRSALLAAAALLCLALACKREPRTAAAPDAAPAKPQPFADVDLPVVAAGAVAEAPPETAEWISITGTSITSNGHALVALEGGGVPPAAKVQGHSGMEIEPLRKHLDQLVTRQTKLGHDRGELVIAADRATSYRTLTAVLFTAKQAGFGSLAIAVRREGAIALLRPHLPVHEPRDPSKPEPAEPPLQMALFVSSTQVRFLSLSGLEGSMQEPKLTLEPGGSGDFDWTKLTATAAEIVARRFPTEPRDPSSLEILIVPDATTPLQRLVDTMVAVRHDRDGRPLFPQVMFGVSIQ